MTEMTNGTVACLLAVYIQYKLVNDLYSGYQNHLNAVYFFWTKDKIKIKTAVFIIKHATMESAPLLQRTPVNTLL